MPVVAKSSSFPGSGSGTLPQVLVIVAIIVGVTGIGYGGWLAVRYQQQSQAKEAAKTFVAALANGDTTHAYQLTSANLQTGTTQAQFTDTFSDLSGAMPSYTHEAVTVVHDQAVFSSTISGFTHTRSGRTQGLFTLGLVHAGNTWQIDSVDVE